MEADPAEVVGYTRVSTDDQAEYGVSLDAQAERVRAFAHARGLAMVRVVEDAGASAKTLDRPGLRKVLQAIAAGEIAGVVVAKVDRLTRSLRDWTALVEEHFGRPGGPRLWSCAEPLDLSTANGRLMGNVLMAFAQFERETIVERTAGAMDHKRAKGERLGTIPYGWMLAPDGRALIHCPDEQLALAQMRAFRFSGLTIREIARELDRLGVPSRTGRPWASSTVAKLLEVKDAA